MILMELDVLSLRVDDFFAMLAEVNSPIELAVKLLHQLLRWQAQFLWVDSDIVQLSEHAHSHFDFVQVYFYDLIVAL